MERLKNQLYRRTPDYFWSFDNNIFRTSVVRQLGGFPTFEPLTVDYFFKVMIERRTNYRWIVDPMVISDHIRLSIRHHFDNLNRIVLYSTKPTELDEVELASQNLVSWFWAWISLGRSLRYLRSALKYKYPRFFIVYPYIRLLEFQWLLLRRERVNHELSRTHPSRSPIRAFQAESEA